MYNPYKPYRVDGDYKVVSSGVEYKPFPPIEVEEKVNQPSHYTWHPCGVEAKDVAQEFSYNIGNAIAYLWRHERKNGIEDLKKAIKHLEFEIERLEKRNSKDDTTKNEPSVPLHIYSEEDFMPYSLRKGGNPTATPWPENGPPF